MLFSYQFEVVCLVFSGPGAVVTAFRNKVQEFSVTPIAADELVDTNGAGDAFVGGFLARLISTTRNEDDHSESPSRAQNDCDFSLADSVQAGLFAASVVCRASGCTLPVEQYK